MYNIISGCSKEKCIWAIFEILVKLIVKLQTSLKEFIFIYNPILSETNLS